MKFIRITQSLHTGEVDQQWVIESDILLWVMGEVDLHRVIESDILLWVMRIRN